MNPLKEIREQYGMSISDISRIYMISRADIEAWESGKRECEKSISTLLLFDIPNSAKLFCVVESTMGNEHIDYIGTKDACNNRVDNMRKNYSDTAIKDCYVDHIVIRIRKQKRNEALKMYLDSIPADKRRSNVKVGDKVYDLDIVDFNAKYNQSFND